MNYITTNIRLPEKNYLKLKEEAFRERKSISAVIREKLGANDIRSESEIEHFMSELDTMAITLGKKLRNFNSVKALREMREKRKW